MLHITTKWRKFSALKEILEAKKKRKEAADGASGLTTGWAYLGLPGRITSRGRPSLAFRRRHPHQGSGDDPRIVLSPWQGPTQGFLLPEESEAGCGKWGLQRPGRHQSIANRRPRRHS